MRDIEKRVAQRADGRGIGGEREREGRFVRYDQKNLYVQHLKAASCGKTQNPSQ